MNKTTNPRYKKHPTVLKKYTYSGRIYGYGYAHKWIKNRKGRASICEELSCTGKSTYYQWSNISHEYKLEELDWRQLCCSCHGKADTTEKVKLLTSLRFKNSITTSKKINQYSKGGQFIRQWPSLTTVYKELGILQSSISNNLSGMSKSAGGYKWTYVDTNKSS